MSKYLPAKYYLKANDPKYALLVQGKVFLCQRSPWEWLSTVTKREDVREMFTVEEVEEIYFAVKGALDFRAYT